MATPGDMSSVSGADPQRLGRVLEDSAAARTEWRPEELGAILRHQLSVPLAFDLGGVQGEQWADLAGGRLTWTVTFGALLAQPSPPIAMLRCVKAFAKQCRLDPLGALPAEVATVLYFSSIVAARLHAGESISDLDEPRLRAGVEWVLSRSWLEDEIHGLMQAGLKSLEAGPQA